MLEEDRELFSVADEDHDGFLTKQEFPAFSHPHEFSKMHTLLVNHTMRRKDTNNDGMKDYFTNSIELFYVFLWYDIWIELMEFR